MLEKASLVRNVAIVGPLHHGKTSLCDMLQRATLLDDGSQGLKWIDKKVTDSRMDEIKREMSIKAAPLQILLQDSREKSYGFNFVDAPGHPDFFDEVCASIRLCDNALLVVDVLEGCTLYTEQLIRLAIREAKPLLVCVNKLDRLILELKLPPDDAYLKIKKTLDEVNIIIQQVKAECPNSRQGYVSPL